MLRVLDPKEPMANYLKMPKKQQVLALLDLGWSYGRIEAETGVRRDPVSGYDRQRQASPAKTFPGCEESPAAEMLAVPGTPASNPAMAFPGSLPNPAKTCAGSRRFVAHPYGALITERLDAGLTVQRIWQDLVEEVGYGASYESVKRYVRRDRREGGQRREGGHAQQGPPLHPRRRPGRDHARGLSRSEGERMNSPPGLVNNHITERTSRHGDL